MIGSPACGVTSRSVRRKKPVDLLRAPFILRLIPERANSRLWLYLIGTSHSAGRCMVPVGSPQKQVNEKKHICFQKNRSHVRETLSVYLLFRAHFQYIAILSTIIWTSFVRLLVYLSREAEALIFLAHLSSSQSGDIYLYLTYLVGWSVTVDLETANFFHFVISAANLKCVINSSAAAAVCIPLERIPLSICASACHPRSMSVMARFQNTCHLLHWLKCVSFRTDFL
jgi:hypothetical protein